MHRKFTIIFFLPFLLNAESFFEKSIAPILESKCIGCHNTEKSKGKVSFSTASEVFNGRKKVIVKGKPEESLLYTVVIPEDGEEPEMPEDDSPLTITESDAIKKWILDGAVWPKGKVLKEKAKIDKSWWAYRKLKHSKPEAKNIPEQWKKNPVDSYIYSSLAAKNLKPSEEADRRTLIRRATLDLTGLPPSFQEVEEFVNSKSPKAYEELIDRLLASPHYGEQWARHWLDVVRFGESNGYERNFIINDLWPFRDYVIRSLNEDKPFNQFIKEHLAGDVIANGDPDIEIGSAFLVAGPYDDVNNQDPLAKAIIRADTMDEIIRTTSEAFLGMTMGCAKCHDHKFDPIKTADYYQMYATFSGIRHGQNVWASQEAKDVHAQKLSPLNYKLKLAEKELQEYEQNLLAQALQQEKDFAKNWTRPKIDRRKTIDEFKTVKAKYIRFTNLLNDVRFDDPHFRLDEFEAYTPEGKNVALAKNGTKIFGEARQIEDFPGAYGPHLAIDGKLGARFISVKPEFILELPTEEEINKIIFSSARGENIYQHWKFTFVAEYKIEISLDGKSWIQIASGEDRQPISKQHKDIRLKNLATTDRDRKIIQELKGEIQKIQSEIQKIQPLPKAWIGKRSENDAKGPFHIFVGGDVRKNGEAVTAASLSTLSEVMPGYKLLPEAPESERRLNLAKWITHNDNPLTTRVLVNRIWHYHFGTGIVNTPSDFGYMGGQPSHPELLDFLALELKKNNWQIKALHKLIMTSQTYMQSSKWRKNEAMIDGNSAYLWRFPPRRLTAEEIRDSILTVSGVLNKEMGGPGFRLYKFTQDNVCTYFPLEKHGPETYRRAVYHQNARASTVDLLTDFDQADCTLSVGKRTETTTPLQALTLMNHSFTVDMANAFADRVEKVSQDKETQVKKVFELAYQRKPNHRETQYSLELVNENGLRALCRAVLNSNELIYVD